MHLAHLHGCPKCVGPKISNSMRQTHSHFALTSFLFPSRSFQCSIRVVVLATRFCLAVCSLTAPPSPSVFRFGCFPLTSPPSEPAHGKWRQHWIFFSRRRKGPAAATGKSKKVADEEKEGKKVALLGSPRASTSRSRLPPTLSLYEYAFLPLISPPHPIYVAI
jgi:hypothetical protein